MILLDIGNSKIKCFEITNIEDIKLLFHIKAEKHILESYIGLLREEDNIYAISTNKAFEEFIIINKFHKVDVEDFEKKMDFKSPYKGYGIDRLLNSYAASRFYSDNILVVSMGSAITYDIVKNQKIEYGYITPGIGYRAEILHVNIPHLPVVEVSTNFKKPTNTEEAISFGIAKEIISTINTIKEEENLDVVITGGYAEYFKNMFKVDTLLLSKAIFLAFKI